MQEENSEFFKLDVIDRKVLFWIMDNSPRSIHSWVEHIAGTYKKTWSIKIDCEKLHVEIGVALTDMAKLRSNQSHNRRLL